MPAAKKTVKTARNEPAPATSFPAFTLTATHPKDIIADALIVNTTPGKGKSVELVAHGFTPAQAKRITTEIEHLGGTGTSGEVIKFASGAGIKAPILVAVGLGDFRKSFDLEQFRQAIGNGVRALSGTKKVAISGGHSPEHVDATVIACALAAYTFTEYKSKPTPTGVGSFAISIPGQITSEMKAALIEAKHIASSIYLARNLINTPPNDLAPSHLVDAAKKALASLPVTVKVWDEKALAAAGCGGILGVGLGSSRPPRLIKMTYAPRGAKAHLSLIGKGITFDTGGISLKRPYDTMMAMKSDMAGSAAILATLTALEQLQPNIRVTALMMMAENAISGTAQRPSDVIKHYGGTTVEVINTDAEGRLVLADGLAFADLNLDPDYLVDIATLTGAATLGLGRQYAAMYTRDKVLAAQLSKAGEASGDRVWHMPLVDDYKDSLGSDIADFNHNASKGKYSAGSVTAALFLENFVGTRRWVHLDIAGTARSEVDAGENSKGGTGFGVRLLTEWITSLS